MSMSSKHTEGPWRVVDGCDYNLVKSENGYYVATVVTCLPGGAEEERANAGLLAAAPTLHRALMNLVNAVNTKPPDTLEMFACIEQARYALTVSGGETL